MSEFENLDRWLLLKINLDWSDPVLDDIFVRITDFHKTSLFIYAVLPLIVVVLTWVLRKEVLGLLVTLICTLGWTDFSAGKLLKPYFERLRPNAAGLDVIVRSPVFGDLGFPSNHATNIFCAAFILGSYIPKARIPLFIFAFFVAYSRPYVGVHYPSDVIVGAIYGCLCAWVALKVVASIRKKRLKGSDL